MRACLRAGVFGRGAAGRWFEGCACVHACVFACGRARLMRIFRREAAGCGLSDEETKREEWQLVFYGCGVVGFLHSRLSVLCLSVSALVLCLSVLCLDIKPRRASRCLGTFVLC